MIRVVAPSEKEKINDDLVFEIKVITQVENNVDYIMKVVELRRESRGDSTDNEIDGVAKIQRAVESSPTQRNKKELILSSVERASADGQIDVEWRACIESERAAELEVIIQDEGLLPEETRTSIEHAFRDSVVPTAGTAVTKILPVVSRFAPEGGLGDTKGLALTRLTDFFDRSFRLSSELKHVD